MKLGDCLPFIVEDDPDFRFLLLQALGKAGIPESRVRIAPDGEEAIVSFGRRPDAAARRKTAEVLQLT